jgi:hypothetical protein
MMILKTNPLKSLALALLVMGAGKAYALDVFECVRDLMPITEQSAFQSKRQGVEKPFMLTDKFMAFPEIKKSAVTGFYIYSRGHAWYYDSFEPKENPERKKPLADLNRVGHFSLYNLVAQPLGLETVMLQFMPGFGIDETTHGGPVMLGSSVMPVIGALMSRTNEQLISIYNNPADSDEQDIKRWIADHSSRRPADVNSIEIDKQMVRLTTSQVKSKTELWAPLKNELVVRKKWVQDHNLAEEAFRRLARVMDTTCKP